MIKKRLKINLVSAYSVWKQENFRFSPFSIFEDIFAQADLFSEHFFYSVNYDSQN